MAYNPITYALKNKSVIILIIAIGILLVLWGMRYNNNLIFIIGLLFVVGGYLLIRRKMKQSTKNSP